MHKYNNQDHSMLSALLAARNILGEEHDIWNINVERSYHENFTDQEWSQLKKKSTQPVAELKPLSRAA